MPWGTETERQVRLRIQLSIAAYAYEIMDDSVMSDHDFDKMCLEIDASIDTGNKKLDKFFKKEFSPHTGQWVHKHPEKRKLHQLYLNHYKKTSK
jgi:hypothetical protein